MLVVHGHELLSELFKGPSLGKITCCSMIKLFISSIRTSAQAKKIFACLGTNVGEQLKDNSSN